MDEVLVWLFGILLLCFVAVWLIGLFGMLFGGAGSEKGEGGKPRRGIAGVFLAGLALGAWWRNDE